jgi:hypothetical protein
MIQTFLIRNWKLSAIGVLLAAVWFLFHWGNSQRVQKIEAETGLKASVKIANMLSSENTFYKNKKGDTVIVTKTIMVPAKQTKPIFDQDNMKGFKNLESIKKDGSNLLNASTFTTEFSLSSEDGKPILLKDSTVLYWFKYKDPYNDINVLMADTSKLDTRNRFWLGSSIVRKKKWFIRGLWSKAKKFEIISEAVDANLKAKIDSLQTITIK